MPRQQKQPYTAYKYNKERFPHIFEHFGDITDVYDNRGRLEHRFDNAKMSNNDIADFVRRRAGREVHFTELF